MQRFSPLAMLLAAATAVTTTAATAAKSPEDFVGSAPAQGQAPSPKPTAGKPVPAGSASAPAPSKPAKSAVAPASPTAAAAPADSAKAKRAADAPKANPAKTARSASGPAAAKPALDTARIHGQYLEGDFEQAIRSLEGALKGRKPLNHGDSVFIFKHLGVMYAASPATREKGRYYMLQLISIEPTARILDMYASDMIYLIFRNLQEEYENKHGKVTLVAPADTVPAASPVAQPEPAPVPAAPTAQGRKRGGTLYWAAGGAAVAAGVAGLLFILLDDPQPKKRTILLKE